MLEQEGVIKYHLDHQPLALSADIDLRQLNAWRSVLYQLQLIGQSPHRYGGLGYGNISQRLVPESPSFLISGSQTGHLARLCADHYAIVHTANPQGNSIKSSGLCPPSSEALTHASVYQLNSTIQAVIHVHSPEIWRHTEKLGLAHTAKDIPYGTVAMANAVAALFANDPLTTPALFTMLGHEDGVVAFGRSLNSAANLLIDLLVAADC